MTQEEFDRERMSEEIAILKSTLSKWYEIRSYLLTPYQLVHDTERLLGLTLTDFAEQEKELEEQYRRDQGKS